MRKRQTVFRAGFGGCGTMIGCAEFLLKLPFFLSIEMGLVFSLLCPRRGVNRKAPDLLTRQAYFFIVGAQMDYLSSITSKRRFPISKVSSLVDSTGLSTTPDLALLFA